MKKVARSVSKVVSETKVVDGKTITETRTERWSDTPEVSDGFWKNLDDAMNACGKMLDEMEKQSVADEQKEAEK